MCIIITFEKPLLGVISFSMNFGNKEKQIFAKKLSLAALACEALQLYALSK